MRWDSSRTVVKTWVNAISWRSPVFKFIVSMKMRVISSYATLTVLMGLAASGCVSVKPIYNSDEQSLAERGVTKLHRLYNDEDFDGLFDLFDVEAQQSMNRDEVIESMRQSFEKTGKIRNAKLSQAKVFPSSPIQVRMIYNIEPERGGPYQEWFIWVNRDGETSLLQVQTFPGHDSGEVK